MDSANDFTPAPAANAKALLRELESMLRRLLDAGVSDSIDLRRLPLFEDDYALLREQLGEGEVHADIENLGASEARETAYPGIWWITHRNEQDEVIAEFIEVTFCPQILISPQEDARDGLERLCTHLEYIE